MAVINIDFSYDDNVKSSIRKAKSALQTRMNDYSGIKKNLNNISTPTGNLSSANTYIQKKINSLDSKYKKLDSFQNAITRFNDYAYDADKRVANRINTDTKQFYKRENIKTGIIYSLGSVIGKGVKWLKGKAEDIARTIVNAVSTAWAAVKKWYEDNKYWIDIVVDVVRIVGTVAALLVSGGGVLAAIFAGWELGKKGTELVFDAAAYGAYKDGDMELYEQLSKGNLKDILNDSGATGKYIYYGMEIASSVYNVYKIGKNTVKTFNDYSKYSQMFSPESFKDVKRQIIKPYIYENLVGKVKSTKFVLKTAKTWLGSDSVGIKVIKTFKITKIFYDIFSNGSNFVKVGSIKSFPSVKANPVHV